MFSILHVEAGSLWYFPLNNHILIPLRPLNDFMNFAAGGHFSNRHLDFIRWRLERIDRDRGKKPTSSTQKKVTSFSFLLACFLLLPFKEYEIRFVLWSNFGRFGNEGEPLRLNSNSKSYFAGFRLIRTVSFFLFLRSKCTGTRRSVFFVFVHRTIASINFKIWFQSIWFW